MIAIAAPVRKVETMCELMKRIQIYTEKPQLWPIYSIYDHLQPQTEAQRRQWMFAERKKRKEENIKKNQAIWARFEIIPVQTQQQKKVAE